MANSSTAIKVLVAVGIRPAAAIRAVLDSSFQGFADAHGFSRSEVSACVHGLQRHARVRGALAETLGVEREWLDELLDSERAELSSR